MMKRTNHVLIMALVAVFVFSTTAMAQTKWAYQSNYSEGMACVKNDQGKWGHVDEQGNQVGQMWRNVKYFQDGLAPVETQDEKWGFVDKTGKLVIPCQYFNVHWFSEGLAAVSISADYRIKYGYIDKTGKVVIPFQFEEAYSFEKGVAKVQDENRVWRKIDKTGKFIE